MIAILVISLAFAGCSVVALPVRPSSDVGPIVGIPFLIQDPTGSRGKSDEESSPTLYGILVGELKKDDTVNGSPIEKRSVVKNDEETDDLETAAGTYALRPLFVYRQQLAYRERVRQANRRRNRF